MTRFMMIQTGEKSTNLILTRWYLDLTEHGPKESISIMASPGALYSVEKMKGYIKDPELRSYKLIVKTGAIMTEKQDDLWDDMSILKTSIWIYVGIMMT